MISLFCWIIIVLICLFSLINAVLSISKMNHISNGSSIFDSDAPQGLRMRKWLLILIGFSNTFRFIFSMFLFIYLIHLKWQHSSILLSNDNYVAMDNLSWLIVYVPSLPHLVTCCFLADYICSVYTSLCGSDDYTRRINIYRKIWFALISFAIASSLFIIAFQFLGKISKSYYWNYFITFSLSTAISMHLLFFSLKVFKELMGSSYVNPSKVLTRLLFIITIVGVSSLYTTIFQGIELFVYQPHFRYVYHYYPNSAKLKLLITY
jgi:hypothetical protein